MGMTRLVALLYMCSIQCAYGFNVDTRFPIVLNGQKGSYFGYAVAFHKNKEGPLALVTGPKSNSTTYGTTIIEPGAVFKCPTTSGNPSSDCKEIVLERTGNARRRHGPDSYYDLKDGMWLGVSLDVQQEQPHQVVTCGHQWKNQIYRAHYLVNGLCYVLNQNLEWSSAAKLIPLVEKDKQSIIPPGIYFYALGQAGTSAAFSQNGQDLILGAPGVYDWIGTVVEYKMGLYPTSVGNAVVPRVPANQNPSPESYIGYSVTSGHFFELGGMSYVAGAPRDANNNGRVYVFEKLGLSKNKFVVQQRMEGSQLGEYFGATVLGVNLDQDDFTDLLIGSPQYSMKNGGDEGRVYVYHSDGVGLQLQKDVIMGSKKPKSRFGSAIANIGDINQDEFIDVAIGAPYEDDSGAIYIYHGAKTGLKPIFSQRIAAKHIDQNLVGFGISIARSMDIDDNLYPDLLIGAYGSDQAVILKSKPVIRVHPRLEFDVTQIDVNTTRCQIQGKKISCFNVAACLSYTGKHVPNITDFLVHLQIDLASHDGQRQSRGYFYHDDKQISSITEGVSLEIGKVLCFEREVHIYDEIQDFITPMIFQMNYSLVHNEDNDSERKGFCSTCPTMDPSLPASITKEILFRTGCGEDNTCTADLRVKANVVGLPEDEPLILGANDSITVNIRVENRAEPAYASSLFIKLPAQVYVINQGHCHIQNQENTTNTGLECNLGNPMPSGVNNTFQIKLDISKLDYTIEQIIIEMNAETASDDRNHQDNRFYLRVPFLALADITIIGHADQAEIVYESKAQFIPVVHKYVILKYLPSPVRSVGVAIYLPLKDKMTKTQLLQIDSIEVSDGRSTVPGSCNVTLTDSEEGRVKYEKNKDDPIDLDEDSHGKDAPNTINLLVNDRSKRDTQMHQLESESSVKKANWEINSQHYALNCSTTICQALVCSVGPFLDTNKVATIKIRMSANMTALTTILGARESISVITEGRVWIRDYSYDPQPKYHRPDQDTVSTDLVNEKQAKKPIAKWIIAVSVGAGFLLLFLILFGLVQLGFFRRKQKEEMDKMLQEGALISPKDEPEPDDGTEKDEFDYINFANRSS